MKRKLLERITRLAAPPARLVAMLLAVCAASGVWAAVKPLAVWNGDFPASGSGTDKRGDYTLSVNSNTPGDGGAYIQITSSSGGVSVLSDSQTKTLSAVSAYSNMPSTNSRVLTTANRGSSAANTVWGGLCESTSFIRVWSSGGGAAASATSTTWDFTSPALHYFGFSYNNVNGVTNRGTACFYDGNTESGSYAYASGQVWADDGVYGFCFGGQYNNGNYRATNAHLTYVAILGSSEPSDIAAWSLTGMSSATTFTDGGTISSETDYSATGVNLNGGTVTVSGEITAAAIFVQADTTLNMVPGTDKLVSTGPVYIADGVTLTINVTANPSDYVEGTALSKDLITGTLYISGSIVKAGTLASVSAGRAAISADTTNNTVSWGYAPMPVWSDGAWLNDNAPDGDTTEIAIDSTTSATFNAGGSYSAVYVIGTGTLAIGANGLTATTLDVAAGASINMENVTATTITGGGVIIYDGTTPSATIDASWIGTVWVKNILQASNMQLLPNSWGNSSSVLRFTNVTGWLANDTVCTVPVELVDDGSNAALTLHYTTAPTTTLTFNEFRGNGTFVTSGTDWPSVEHKVLKWDSFTGSLNIDRGRFVFGTGTSSKWRCICVSANQSVEVASGATWTGSTGFVVDSGATLTATGTLAYGGLDGNAVSGAGTVVFDGKTPNTGTDWWTTSGWTGTVWVKNIDPISYDVRSGYTQFSPNDYGWTGSTLKLTGIKGFINGTASGFTINPKLELEDGSAGYGLWLSNGNGFNSDNGNYSVLTELKGTGMLIGSGSGDNVMLMVNKWSDFAGTLSLTNKVVVFGTTKPTKDTINYGGYIIVDTDQSVTIPSTKTWYAKNKIIVNGTLSATGKDRWDSTILVNDDGVLELTSTSNANESSSGTNKDYSSVTGTGTLKYSSSSGWRTFPNEDAKMPAATLTLQVEVADSLIITKGDASNPTTIGSLSGSKNIRSDWEQVQGATTARLLNINQTKDTTWSGHTANGDRIDTITVSGGGTLTLAASEYGNEDKLAVEATGSVNLTGLWKGATTVAGTFGGTGTLTGALTFSDGATFKVFDAAGDGTADTDADGLNVSGAVTVGDSGTVTVTIADGASIASETVILTATSISGTFTLDSLLAEDYDLAVGDTTLTIAPKDTSITGTDGTTVVGYMDGTTAVINNTSVSVTIPATATGVEIQPTGSQFTFNISSAQVLALYNGNFSYSFKTTVGGTKVDISDAFTMGENADVQNGVFAMTLKSPTVPTVAAGTDGIAPVFTVTTVPGLWYGVVSGTNPAAMTLVSGSAVQAAAGETSKTFAAPAFTGTVQYYTVVVGVSEDEMQ